MFKDNFKAFLEEQNISSNSLAKTVGIPQTTISNWITRGSKPNIEDIIKICDYFQCSIDYLLGRESEDGVIIINNNNTSFSIEEKQLITLFRKLDNRQKSALLGFAKGLLA